MFTLAEAGAAGIVVADIDEAKAQTTAEKSKQFSTNLKYRAIVVQADVTNADSVQSAVDTTVKKFRRIDYCIHSAGVRHPSPFPR